MSIKITISASRSKVPYGALDVMGSAAFMYVGMWHSEAVETEAGGVKLVCVGGFDMGVGWKYLCRGTCVCFGLYC